jgi:hypothetical protein
MIKYKVRNEELDMIKVFQVTDQEAIHPKCTFTYGMGDIGWDPLVEGNLDKYEHVADLDAKDLNEAFEIGNIGPEHKITRYSDRIHSLSVGDILEVDGVKHIVARFGFDRLAA